MKIGIDISQLAYSNTGVSNFLKNLIENLLKFDKENEYVLFYSSLRKKLPDSLFWTHEPYLKIKKENINAKKVVIYEYKFPPILLDFLWNKLHIFPIENLIGKIDIFITSDWTEPPVKKAFKATIIYDLIIYKYPNETDKRIIETQKRKLKWVKKESDLIFTISESTKKDVSEILDINYEKIKVIYPGLL